MRRFLQYALDKGKKLKIMYLLNGRLQQQQLSVLSFDEESVCLKQGSKKPFTLPLCDILACDYARGDQGEGFES